MRLEPEHAFVEVLGIAESRGARHRRHRSGETRESFGARYDEASDAGHRAGAVHEREAFLGREHERLESGGCKSVASRERVASGRRLAFPRNQRGEIGERGEVAAGADRAFFRNAGEHAAAQQGGAKGFLITVDQEGGPVKRFQGGPPNRAPAQIANASSALAEGTATGNYLAGLGVNVNQMLEDFPAELQESAGSLRMAAGRPIERSPLAVALLRKLEASYRAFMPAA
jgi:hypothetical protein